VQLILCATFLPHFTYRNMHRKHQLNRHINTCLPIQVHFLENINRLHMTLCFTGNRSICHKAHRSDTEILIQNNNQTMKTFIYIAVHLTIIIIITRGQSNLTKSASRGAHSPVRGHPRGSKVVPLNSWGRVSY